MSTETTTEQYGVRFEGASKTGAPIPCDYGDVVTFSGIGRVTRVSRGDGYSARNLGVKVPRTEWVIEVEAITGLAGPTTALAEDDLIEAAEGPSAQDEADARMDADVEAIHADIQRLARPFLWLQRHATVVTAVSVGVLVLCAGILGHQAG